MNDVPFALDPRLASDTHTIGELPLSRVLLMDDARFPWLILVPRLACVRELTELAHDNQHVLLDEIDRVAHVLHAIAQPDKLNIAMLGNVVSQLHVHLVARFAGDAAWPRPVWGDGERVGYPADEVAKLCAEVRTGLGLTHT